MRRRGRSQWASIFAMKSVQQWSLTSVRFYQVRVMSVMSESCHHTFHRVIEGVIISSASLSSLFY
jgi:hypothetical protein